MGKFFFRVFNHTKTVITHKKVVLKLCIKAGIPFQGLFHDLSKFSPTEFSESVKYYTNGKQSPILACKKEKGFSKAWLHHIKHNKHHLDYWINPDVFYGAELVPYKYWVELICDNLAAGIVYLKGDWTNQHQRGYWENHMREWKAKEGHFVHPGIEKAISEIFEIVANQGIEKTITPEVLKEVYNKNVGNFK